MKAFEYKTKDWSYRGERFTDIQDLLLALDRPLNGGKNSSHTEDADSWTDHIDYEGSVKALKNGIDRGVDEWTGALVAHCRQFEKVTFETGVQGFAPIVPLALMGVPQNMIRDVRKPVKMKVIDLIVDVCVSAMFSTEQYIHAGKKILEAIIDLEKQGYRINLSLVSTINIGNSVEVFMLEVKNERQPLDLKALTFPLLSSAFFRRTIFAWYERFPNGRVSHHSGYGHVFHSDQHVDDMRAMLGSSVVPISLQSAIKTDDLQQYIKDALVCEVKAE